MVYLPLPGNNHGNASPNNARQETLRPVLATSSGSLYGRLMVFGLIIMCGAG